MGMHYYVTDVCFISAYRSNRTASVNRRNMSLLGDDLLRRCYRFTRHTSSCEGVLEETYIVPVYPVDLRTMLRLARKYEQDTIIFRGRLYQSSSGKVIGTFRSARVYRRKPKSPYWTKLGPGEYLVMS